MASRVDAAAQTPDDIDRRLQAVMEGVIETADPNDPVDRKTISVARLAVREAETRIALRRRRPQVPIPRNPQRCVTWRGHGNDARRELQHGEPRPRRVAQPRATAP